MKHARLLKSAAAAALLGALSLGARADLVFEWSITNTQGDVAGTASGMIYGLTDNSTSAATLVTIDGFPAGLDSVYPAGSIDTSLWDQQLQNSFTVSAGEITAASFWAQNTVGVTSVGSQLYLDGGAGPYNFINIDGADTRYVWAANGFENVSFTQVDANAVPEPASLALVGIALTAAAVARRRRA